MAEKKRSDESVKLFVGQVPKHMEEEELLALFQEFAAVEAVNVIRDKATRNPRGCCFVTFPSREEAEKAISSCHNKRTLPGASSPLQVKYANGELERLEHKLFVGMLPKNVTEEEVSDLFSKYGTIKDMHILRGSQQTSKGCAFLKYETKEQAVEALNALNGKHKMEGLTIPLVVKWADTEKERQARRAQKAQCRADITPDNDPKNPSSFGAIPVGYIPPYNGYGCQAPGPFGLVQYRMQPMQNQFHNLIPPAQGSGTLRAISPALAHRNFLPPVSYMGSAYPAVPGLRYPMTYPGVLMGHRPFSGSSASMIAENHLSTPSSISQNLGGQNEGPPGANLFIYHIPQEFGDQDLANAFRPYGQVISAKVFVDKATGASKCFGFVSYDSPEAAQSAIGKMNGQQIGGNKLKVQLKRENKQSKIY